MGAQHRTRVIQIPGIATSHVMHTAVLGHKGMSTIRTQAIQASHAAEADITVSGLSRGSYASP